MLEIYFKTSCESEFKQIRDVRVGSWIYAKEAHLEDLSEIIKISGLDIADIRDSLDKYELPRLEYVNDNLILFVRHPTEREFGRYTETLTMILNNNYVIAISPSRSEIIEQLLSGSTNLETTQKAKLILQILLKVTQDYTNSIKRIRQSIVGYEMTHEMVDSNAIIILTKNEEILNQFLISLVPMRNLLEMMAGGRYIAFYEKDLDLLQDLMIASKQSEDICRVNIKSIRSLRDSYHIIFTNDVNRTIKLLTALTIIFSIPTAIASIYGMNIALPLQARPYAFIGILGFITITSLLAIFWFKSKRWL